MKILVFAVVVLMMGIGCVSVKDDAVSKASEMIRSGQAECVIVSNNKIVLVERGRGVSPLLNVYERHPDTMKDCIVVDKVIGRAAAFIAIAGKASHVHSEVMSEDAVELLKENGITTSQALLVPRILNQKRDGLCPLEQSVLGLATVDEALPAMKKRIAELQKK